MIRIRTAADFAVFVRQARLEQNLSQEALAAQVDKSRNWVSSVETGKTMPTLPAVLLLATALGFVTGFKERDKEGDRILATIKKETRRE